MVEFNSIWNNKVFIAVGFLIFGMIIMIIITNLSNKTKIETTVCDCSNNFEDVKPTITTKPLTTKPPTTKPPIKTNKVDLKLSNMILPTNEPLNFSNWMRSNLTSYSTELKALSGYLNDVNKLSGATYKSCKFGEKLCEDKCVPHQQKCEVPTIDQINCEESLNNKWCKTEKKCISVSNECQKKIGSDTDSHGCKASAGYTWCPSKQKCIRAWEEKCTMVGADTDSHSCKASTGYTWCPSKNKCLKLWEEKCD